MTQMELLNLLQIVSSLTTSTALIFLVLQIREQRKVVKAQTRATEIETYVNINHEFMSLLSNIKVDLDDPNLKIEDLNFEEKKKLDRYFYLCNLEYIMVLEKTVRGELSIHWLEAIKSGASKKIIVDRWKESSQRLSFNPQFRDFFNQAIAEVEKSK